LRSRFTEAGGTLIDAQWDSPFLRSLGAEPIPREDYLPQLTASTRRSVLPAQPLPARRLLSVGLAEQG
jgi:leucyl/phenylalanyl-tRNA--protein transferase